MFFKITHIKL